MSAQDRIPPPEQLDGFLDGELSPVERSAVEAHLAEHREAQQLLEQQRQMRQWIRQSVTQKAEEAAANVDFDRLTQRIMQGIQKPVVALATIRITTQPAGVRVFVNKKPQGKTPLTLRLPQGKRVTIQLKKKGFVMQQFFWDAAQDATHTAKMIEDLF